MKIVNSLIWEIGMVNQSKRATIFKQHCNEKENDQKKKKHLFRDVKQCKVVQFNKAYSIKSKGTDTLDSCSQFQLVGT